MAILPIMLGVVTVFAILMIEGLITKDIVVGTETYFRSYYHLGVFMLFCASIMVTFISLAYIIVVIVLGV